MLKLAEHEHRVHEALVSEPDVEALGDGGRVGGVLLVRVRSCRRESPACPRRRRAGSRPSTPTVDSVHHVVERWCGCTGGERRSRSLRIARRPHPRDRLRELPDVPDGERADQQWPPARAIGDGHGDDQERDGIEEQQTARPENVRPSVSASHADKRELQAEEAAPQQAVAAHEEQGDERQGKEDGRVGPHGSAEDREHLVQPSSRDADSEGTERARRRDAGRIRRGRDRRRGPPPRARGGGAAWGRSRRPTAASEKDDCTRSARAPARATRGSSASSVPRSDGHEAPPAKHHGERDGVRPEGAPVGEAAQGRRQERAARAETEEHEPPLARPAAPPTRRGRTRRR